MTRDDLLQPAMHGAFVRDGFGALPEPPVARHATLAGRRLAVKDVFDVARLRGTVALVLQKDFGAGREVPG